MRRTLVVFCACSLVLFGCQAANKPPANEAAPSPNVMNKSKPHVQQTAPEKRKNLSAQQRADRLSKLATNVPNVKGATTVVAGNYTVVGIDVESTLDRSRVGTLKYTVAQALKEDPHGANALVTADTDIVQRLREMRNDMRQGRPVRGFVEELADIAGRIAPQPSQQIEQEEQPPDQMEQNEQNQTPDAKPARHR